MNVTYQLLKRHLISGDLLAGQPITIRIDQTLTQDSTGTMVYLQLEQLGIERVKTDLSVAYIDHNTLQSGFENMDDHLFIQSVADKYGIVFSKAGNGICHQVHLERFIKPGVTLLGSDSHTPNSGAMGALCIGAGGLDVACAMAGIGFKLICPAVVKVTLLNELSHGVGAKDVILHLLGLLSVKGNVNQVIEYSGPGVKSLSVTQRATITNMGAELGVTTSIFPSDERTLEFLTQQGRAEDYQPLQADDDAKYDKEIIIDLAQLVPLAACPSMPDNIKPVEELSHIKVNQVLIGSCTNASYADIMEVVNILKGRQVHPSVSLGVACGSKNVMMMVSANGGMEVLLAAGARILESTCGACIGMGQAPNSQGVSVRTFNRNFVGRSGTKDAQVYLVSPATAAITAITGYLTSATTVEYDLPTLPAKYTVNDSLILKPTYQAEIIKGPNIESLVSYPPLSLPHQASVVIKLPDDITTDHILPGGTQVLPYRSNLTKISTFTFIGVDKTFYQRVKERHGGIIVAGANYGQGSSREHAAMTPRTLNIQVVIAKSFARIHHANLINSGILPLEFVNPDDYHQINQDDELMLTKTDNSYNLVNLTNHNQMTLIAKLSTEDQMIIDAGGYLNYLKQQISNNRT